jgi:hypothetical protein
LHMFPLDSLGEAQVVERKSRISTAFAIGSRTL